METKNILVVDDDLNIESAVQEYKDLFEELNAIHNFGYKINFDFEQSIEKGILKLNSKEQIIDVVLIDYDFPNNEKNLKGIHLVSQIRETINKRCKIVFYTMHGLDLLEKIELVSLINNGVYRFISKSGDFLLPKYKLYGDKADQLIVEALIDAINDTDPVSNSLEKYLIKYSMLLKNVKFSHGESQLTIKELINSIRLYKEPGNTFVDNLIEMSVVDLLHVEED